MPLCGEHACADMAAKGGDEGRRRDLERRPPPPTVAEIRPIRGLFNLDFAAVLAEIATDGYAEMAPITPLAVAEYISAAEVRGSCKPFSRIDSDSCAGPGMLQWSA